VVLAACAMPAFALDLPQLMGLLSQNRSGEATFTELRFVHGLDQPLESTGTLSFAAPDKFTRKTLSPRAESMSIDGNTLTLSRGSRSRSLALDAAPEMIGIVEAVRGTLTGNSQTLQRYFSSSVAGTPDKWTLELTPLDDRLARALRRVTLGGRQGELRSVEMLFPGGDHSLMTIEPKSLQRAPAPGAASSSP